MTEPRCECRQNGQLCGPPIIWVTACEALLCGICAECDEAVDQCCACGQPWDGHARRLDQVRAAVGA